MATYKPKTEAQTAKTELALRLQMLQGPEIMHSLDELYAKYGRYAVPIDELRRALDKTLGDKSLTEELYAMREGR